LSSSEDWRLLFVSYLLGDVGVSEDVSDDPAGVRCGGVAVRGPPGWSRPVSDTGSSRSSSSSENEISEIKF
jgi:hypothetical protein